MLDAATVDRCDFFEICCFDVPCLTEAMQRRAESLNEAGLPKVLGPTEGDTKKRRVESFDESVDWCQREVIYSMDDECFE